MDYLKSSFFKLFNIFGIWVEPRDWPVIHRTYNASSPQVHIKNLSHNASHSHLYILEVSHNASRHPSPLHTGSIRLEPLCLPPPCPPRHWGTWAARGRCPHLRIHGTSGCWRDPWHTPTLGSPPRSSTLDPSHVRHSLQRCHLVGREQKKMYTKRLCMCIYIYIYIYI